MRDKRFSVVIPTLRRSAELRPLVDQCAAHPLVAEVLVVNNAPGPLQWESGKVRVLQQEQNIFVNPAWNLAVAQSTGDYLALVNDDVRFDDAVFDYCAQVLARGRVGIIGPDGSCFKLDPWRPLTHRTATYHNILVGFGVFMAMRREDYVPIPEEMKIWGGDDWLYLQQRQPNAILVSTRFVTEMGTTAGSPEFKRLQAAEQRVCAGYLDPLWGKRWWHRPTEWLQKVRHYRHRLRSALQR